MCIEKRKIFDQYGEEGLKAGFGGGSDAADMGRGSRFSARDPNDVFKQFFSSCTPLAPHVSPIYFLSRFLPQLVPITMMIFRASAPSVSAQVDLVEACNSNRAWVAVCTVVFSPVLVVSVECMALVE
jgi:hypothetical protein